jgi:hypothetical protein
MIREQIRRVVTRGRSVRCMRDNLRYSARDVVTNPPSGVRIFVPVPDSGSIEIPYYHILQ